MTTLENNNKIVAQPHDLQLIQVIIRQFEYYDCYYGNLCKMKLELKYKEYSTLREDFRQFYETTELSKGVFSIKELSSLKRSLIMLRDRYELLGFNANQVYFSFLNDSIANLDKWINEVINVIVEEIR